MLPATLTLFLAAAISCTLSAAVGMGGSLILVPLAILVLGVKPGIAFAAVILAINNVGKVIVVVDNED